MLAGSASGVVTSGWSRRGRGGRRPVRRGVWSADVDGDGQPELVIGWRESLELEGVTQAGAVAVGDPGGDYDVFTQSTPGVPETNQNFDRFGTQAVP